jgi:predicted metal-binding protein
MTLSPHKAPPLEAPQAYETRTTVARVTVFVCVSCRASLQAAQACDRPGAELVDVLTQRLREAGADDVTVTGVACLAVCKRPATIAIAAQGHWTYIVGDLDLARDVDDIVTTILAYRRSENGIVPWKERPAPFRKGVIARVPPLGFVQPETETA